RSPGRRRPYASERHSSKTPSRERAHATPKRAGRRVPPRLRGDPMAPHFSGPARQYHLRTRRQCMRAMVLERSGRHLELRSLPVPQPGVREVLLRVEACAVCRTDLHIIDGELTDPALPLVPGHEIVGRVEGAGPGSRRYGLGQRVGVPWLGRTCGRCRHCRSGRENLCPDARFTGYHLQGGYAEYTVAHEDFCLAIPDGYGAVSASPLLCAGLIGYRTLTMAGDARRIGIYGFGAAAHIVAQVMRHEGRELYAFTRAGDTAAQAFARE